MEVDDGYRTILRERRVTASRRLESWADAYISLRESLGFTIVELRKNLKSLIRFMREREIGSFDDLDRPSAACYLHLGSPQEMTVVVRLACLRGFFRYLASLGGVRENVWESFTNPRIKRFVPYVFSHAELRAILEEIRSKITPKRPIRSHGQEAFYGIVHTLYACGLRICEVCALDIGDVNFDESLLVIRNSKFHKSRLVPFNTRTKEILTDYLQRSRPADDGMLATAPFFLSYLRRRCRIKALSERFARTCQEAGVYRRKRIEGKTVFGGTTTHALRHSFAVHRLLKWYEEGADVQSKLPLLATYMGHVNYHSTQRYLTVLPVLVDIAGKRFAESFEKPLRDLL